MLITEIKFFKSGNVLKPKLKLQPTNGEPQNRNAARWAEPPSHADHAAAVNPADDLLHARCGYYGTCVEFILGPPNFGPNPKLTINWP